MSNATRQPKPLVILAESIKTPPITAAGRKEAGDLLREIQNGTLHAMPTSRPMPSIGSHVHELRVRDEEHNWRIVYRIDADAIVVVMVFAKTTQRTPKRVIDECQRRLKRYDAT